jgi:putative transposase
VHREQRLPAMRRNDIWSIDFVADQPADGRRFRALTVLELFTRECLAIDVGKGLGGRDVVAGSSGSVTSAACRSASIATTAASSFAPRRTVSDANGIILDFSRRGNPTDNATIESFTNRSERSA